MAKPKISQTYDYAIREFVSGAYPTINLRLAAVRRVAYEAADAGLLSPELAAGIRRVKGVRRIGVRLGNWLTPEQGRRLLDSVVPSTRRQLRDHAMVAMLIGCGSRRAELLGLAPRVGPATGGALSGRRSRRQGRLCPHGPDSAVGKGDCGRLDSGSRDHARPSVPRDQ